MKEDFWYLPQNSISRSVYPSLPAGWSISPLSNSSYSVTPQLMNNNDSFNNQANSFLLGLQQHRSPQTVSELFFWRCLLENPQREFHLLDSKLRLSRWLTTFTRPLGRTIVHVQVGKDLQDSGFHKDLICHHLPYFRAAFTSSFEENSHRYHGNPWNGGQNVDIFYNWLYTQTLWDETADNSE